MATKELLLVILVVILIGLSVVVAISVLNEHNRESNKDAIRQEMLILAANAQSYYLKPIALGGGGSNFLQIEFKFLGIDSVNENGRYVLSDITRNSFTVTGITRNNENRIVGIVTKEGVDFQ